jgi:hypothetical protein
VHFHLKIFNSRRQVVLVHRRSFANTASATLACFTPPSASASFAKISEAQPLALAKRTIIAV